VAHSGMVVARVGCRCFFLAFTLESAKLKKRLLKREEKRARKKRKRRAQKGTNLHFVCGGWGRREGCVSVCD
jgi:hypothetical protein